MELTHTADDGLACLLVGLYAECRVLFGELLKTDAELVKVFLSLGLYGDTDHRIGELHSLKHDGVVLVAECVTCAYILETYTGTDVTAADFLHRVLLVRVHLEQTRHTLLLARTGVENVATGVNVA